jgi:hypothetical protein
MLFRPIPLILKLLLSVSSNFRTERYNFLLTIDYYRNTVIPTRTHNPRWNLHPLASGACTHATLQYVFYICSNTVSIPHWGVTNIVICPEG